MNIRFAVIITLLWMGFSHPLKAEETVSVRGDACYMYGDSETPKTAKKSALDLAKRAAVENYKVFVDSSSVVEMGNLKEDLMATVSGGFLYNLQVINQKERNREICVEVTAVVKPREVEEYVQRKLAEQKVVRERAAWQKSQGTQGPGATGITGGAAATGRRIPDHCRDELDTVVAMHDYLQRGEHVTQLRRRLLDQATSEAVRQSVGVKVRSNTAAEFFSSDTHESEKFAQRMISQSKGFVRYEVEQENTGQDNRGQWLWVRITAHVCVPKDPLALKEVVRIDQAVTARGEDIPEFRDILESVFSSTKAFSMANANEAFADVVIRGRLNDIKVKPISNGRRHRIEIYLTLKALRTGDNETVTQNIRDFKVVKASTSIDTASTKLIAQKIGEAAVKLHDKLLSKRPDAARIPKAAHKSQSNEPEW